MIGSLDIPLLLTLTSSPSLCGERFSSSFPHFHLPPHSLHCSLRSYVPCHPHPLSASSSLLLLLLPSLVWLHDRLEEHDASGNPHLSQLYVRVCVCVWCVCVCVGYVCDVCVSSSCHSACTHPYQIEIKVSLLLPTMVSFWSLITSWSQRSTILLSADQ